MRWPEYVAEESSSSRGILCSTRDKAIQDKIQTPFQKSFSLLHSGSKQNRNLRLSEVN